VEVVEPSRRNATARESEPSQPPRTPATSRTLSNGRTPNGLFFFFHLLSSEAPPAPVLRINTARPPPRRSIQKGRTRKEHRSAREKEGKREDDDGLGTCGPHRSPVADVTRPRGIFKVWWWLVRLIRALLLCLLPPHCKCAPSSPRRLPFTPYLEKF